MKKKSWIYRAVGMVTLAVTLSAFAALAADVGSSGDPLVTLSYLNRTYLPQILSQVDSKLTSRDTALKAELDSRIQQAEQRLSGLAAGGGTASDSAATYAVVTLSKGQVLYGQVGTEVLLRIGTASCVSSSAPGLVDSTTGGSIDSGRALTANHLYLMTVEGRGVKATANTVKLLVRGSYTLS